MCMTVNEAIARTNKLICGSCKRKIKKGDSVLFYLENGKFHNVNCIQCDTGKLELDALEQERILVDIYGIGQG